MLSESHDLRDALAQPFDVTDDADDPIGLLVARPADAAVGSPTWIAYESGDCVLRRSRNLGDVTASVVHHFHTLRHALESEFLALRVRPIVQPDGTAVLVSPGPIHALAGLDRRLATNGSTVLPTTVAAVDIDTFALVVPDAVPHAGRFPIESIVALDRGEDALPGVAALLSLGRHTIVAGDVVPHEPLRSIGALLRSRPHVLRLLGHDAIIDVVHQLGVGRAR